MAKGKTKKVLDKKPVKKIAPTVKQKAVAPKKKSAKKPIKEIKLTTEIEQENMGKELPIEQELQVKEVEVVSFESIVSEAPSFEAVATEMAESIIEHDETPSFDAINPPKKAKSLDFEVEVIDANTEELKQRIANFNSSLMRTTFTARHIMEEFANKEFGVNNIEVLTGLSSVEIAFKIKGIRTPEEGFYFIRP